MVIRAVIEPNQVNSGCLNYLNKNISWLESSLTNIGWVDIGSSSTQINNELSSSSNEATE